jgi:sugar phosphate isomerase/epimerase
MLLSTRSLTWHGLDKIFSIAKKANCTGIDLSVDYDSYDTLDALYIHSLIERYGMPVLSVTAPSRRMTKKQAFDMMTLADTIGAKFVNLTPPHRSDSKDWYIGDNLQVLDTKYPNITINIVNAPPKTWLFIISEYGDARPETIKKMTEHTTLSIENVEPESGVDLIKTFTLLGNTIELVYFSDKTEETKWLFPGEGHMPLESLLIRMKEAEFPGEFILDVSPASLSVGNDSEVIKRIEKAEEYLHRYF